MRSFRIFQKRIEAAFSECTFPHKYKLLFTLSHAVSNLVHIAGSVKRNRFGYSKGHMSSHAIHIVRRCRAQETGGVKQ